MSLIPYEPFRQLDHMRRELDRFFGDEFPGFQSSSLGRIHVDVYETDHEVVATCDIPGLEKKEDVSIEIDQNVLMISGSLNRTKEMKDQQMHRQERFYGRFQRTIQLPSPVSSEDVKASYKNGVLEVRMPKLQADTRKRINIEFH